MKNELAYRNFPMREASLKKKTVLKIMHKGKENTSATATFLTGVSPRILGSSLEHSFLVHMLTAAYVNKKEVNDKGAV